MTAREQLKTGEVIPGTAYRVIRLLGAGGMGSVYEVEHQELGKRFVLKTLLSELSTRADLVQRLRTEWRALGKLEHPNIVRVSDAGVAEGRFPYFVMERLMGQTLADRLAQQRQLPVEVAIQVAIGVLDALSVAHNIGIIHRDVKPPNIFITVEGVPKLLDFGIAKLIDASSAAITARGVAVGTPRYMSPEQAAGDPVDARADLYAVGLVLYEMISGAGPYRVNDANEMFLAHLTQPAPALSTQAARVSLELDAITASLLAKLPAQRPTSAKAAAQALRAALTLYQKPGATPLVNAAQHDSAKPMPAVRGPAAVTVTGAISEATTRPGDVQASLQAPTQRFDPAVVQTTHAEQTVSDINARDTVDERSGRALRRSDPPQAVSNTVHIDDQPAARGSERPPASAGALAVTRTAGVPLAAAPEAGVTPPPVTSAPAKEAYRRWLFPAVVLLLAVVAVVLSRRSARQAALSEEPTPAVAAPTPPLSPVVPTARLSAQPSADVPSEGGAPASAPVTPAVEASAQGNPPIRPVPSGMPARLPGPGTSQPAAKTSVRGESPVVGSRSSRIEPLEGLEGLQKPNKPGTAASAQPPRSALPPSGL
jgi:serine/threonine-protein kinase